MESRATRMTDPRLDAALGGLHFARQQEGVIPMRAAVERVIEIITDGEEASHGNDEGAAPQS